jgi:hypothetical protein
MRKLTLIGLVGSVFLAGCGSSDPAPENPTSSTPAPASNPAATAPAPDPNAGGAPMQDPNGLPPENQGGTAIKANELGPQ